MAYQLKTTGIAAKCTMCIAVDPDTNTIKDFASSAVTADMTVGANVTIAEQAWDGITRKYFRQGAGATAADYVAFGTNKPQWTFGSAGVKRTVVYICEAAGQTPRAWGASSSNYFFGQNAGLGGNTKPAFVSGATLTGSGTALASGEKVMFGFLLDYGVASTAFYATDTASSMTMVTGLGGISPSPGTYDFGIAYIGRRNDSGTKQQDKTHAALIFNDLLTEAELDSLRNDWFGTLLETAGSSFSVTGAGGIASGQAFGNPSLTFSFAFEVSSAGGIASGEAFGSHSLSFDAPFSVVGAGGIAPTSAFGAATLSFTTGGTLNFQAAGMEFGRRTGLGISTFSLDAGASYRYTVHADALTMGAAILTSSAISLDGAGKLPNLSSASLTPGTTYRVVAIRQADGEAATFRMVAQ